MWTPHTYTYCDVYSLLETNPLNSFSQGHKKEDPFFRHRAVKFQRMLTHVWDPSGSQEGHNSQTFIRPELSTLLRKTLQRQYKLCCPIFTIICTNVLEWVSMLILFAIDLNRKRAPFINFSRLSKHFFFTRTASAF